MMSLFDDDYDDTVERTAKPEMPLNDLVFSGEEAEQVSQDVDRVLDGFLEEEQ